jgi:hypothetical protein
MQATSTVFNPRFQPYLHPTNLSRDVNKLKLVVGDNHEPNTDGSRAGGRAISIRGQG